MGIARRLALGRLISLTGGSAAYIALVAAIYDETGSAAWVSGAGRRHGGLRGDGGAARGASCSELPWRGACSGPGLRAYLLAVSARAPPGSPWPERLQSWRSWSVAVAAGCGVAGLLTALRLSTETSAGEKAVEDG